MNTEGLKPWYNAEETGFEGAVVDPDRYAHLNKQPADDSVEQPSFPRVQEGLVEQAPYYYSVRERIDTAMHQPADSRGNAEPEKETN